MEGTSLFSLGCAPVLVDGVTYVPVELFDALLGYKEGTVNLEGNAVKINTGSVQIPNPFAEYETLADAARAAGFTITVPDAANGSDRQVFQAIQGELLEVIYRRGGDETARIRKAPGTGDISGDYNQIRPGQDGKRHHHEGRKRSGDGCDLGKNGHTYSVTAQGSMNDSAMTALIRAVK